MEQIIPIEEIQVGDLVKQRCATGCRDYMAIDNCNNEVPKTSKVLAIVKNPPVRDSNFYYMVLADGQTAYGWTGTPITKVVPDLTK
jgi:hypothetical protein